MHPEASVLSCTVSASRSSAGPSTGLTFCVKSFHVSSDTFSFPLRPHDNTVARCCELRSVNWTQTHTRTHTHTHTHTHTLNTCLQRRRVCSHVCEQCVSRTSAQAYCVMLNSQSRLPSWDELRYTDRAELKHTHTHTYEYDRYTSNGC